MNKLYQDVQSVLYDRETLSKRVNELGKMITRDYEGKNVIMVCILKGSSVFYADLVRDIDLDVTFDFMIVSSYGNGSKSSNNVKIIQDLRNDIRGRNVIIVEDIIDSGNTMYNLKNVLLEREPASLKICTLIDKKSRRQVKIDADYVGFDLEEDAFIIGYGLDYAEKYRNIPEVCTIKAEAIK